MRPEVAYKGVVRVETLNRLGCGSAWHCASKALTVMRKYENENVQMRFVSIQDCDSGLLLGLRNKCDLLQIIMMTRLLSTSSLRNFPLPSVWKTTLSAFIEWTRTQIFSKICFYSPSLLEILASLSSSVKSPWL
jgi:hypothetical protein